MITASSTCRWPNSEHLDAAGIKPSTGAAGSSYDNALAESVIGLYKTELIKARRPW
jgi:putative transposase